MVLRFVFTLKETSTAKVTGSWRCSMWQTRLVTTLSGFPPVTIRSKSKHSFSSRPKQKKDKSIDNKPINQLYQMLFTIYNFYNNYDYDELLFIPHCPVWHTYSPSRGLYFYDMDAALPLPLKKDAGFAVVPHLIHPRHTSTMNNCNCGTQWFDRKIISVNSG